MDAAEGGITAGTVLAGKYRIDAIVGRGGMGMVYRAQHLALNEPVAMKVLRRDVALDEDTVTRFVREAQAAVKLKSEHVARIQDVGNLEDGLPYMVMEFLEGADLGDLVDRNGAMYTGIAVDLLLQACDAIAEAHSLGIVHRDVKPTNLFVSFRPDQTAIVKVLDFGISKSAGAQDLSLTQTQSMLGTPAYMSPEQMRSARDVDARTDIWSLGTVLYELVEARRPFQAESFSEMCVMVALDAPAPLVNAPELADVIDTCLAKDPAQRYANVAALAVALAPFANNQDAAKYYVTRAHRVLGLARATPSAPSPALRTPGPSLPPPLQISALTMHAPARTAAPTLDTIADGATRLDPVVVRPHRHLWIAAVSAVAIAVGGAATYAAMPGPERPPPALVAPKREAQTEPPAQAEPPSEPAPEAPPAPRVDPKPAPLVPLAAGSGVTAPRSTPPPVRRPRPRPQPTAVARPIARPVVETPAPAPAQKKCDPFGSRTGCK